MKVYPDTNVLIDYFVDRSDGLRPWSQFAFEFFSKGWNCAYKIIISDWTKHEALKQLTSEEFDKLIKYCEESNKLVFVNKTKEDVEKAKKTDNFPDQLHLAIAERVGADVIVTRDEAFLGFSSNLNILYPENV